MPSEARYAEWPARRSPRTSVACVWVSRPSGTTGGLVLPDACVDVIWDGASLFVAGPDTGPVPVIARPGQFFSGVRFRPGKAPGFLGVRANELLDLRVPLADLWGRACAERLASRLAAAVSAECAAGMLDEAVADRARTALEPDPIIDGLLQIFMSAPPGGSWAVQLASRAMCVGERRLYRHCKAAVGYGPKMLDRVLRFQRARRIARRVSSLASVAAEAGYADQAHLTRECRTLAGVTPSDLFKTARPTGS